MPQPVLVKRREILMVLSVVGCLALAVIGLMARRYGQAAALGATMRVEQHSPDVDTTGWVMVNGVRHTFTLSGTTNFTVSGRALAFGFDKLSGTNDLDVSMFSQSRLVRREVSPRHIEGFVICPSPRMAGLKFWKPIPRVTERMQWYR